MDAGTNVTTMILHQCGGDAAAMVTAKVPWEVPTNARSSPDEGIGRKLRTSFANVLLTHPRI